MAQFVNIGIIDTSKSARPAIFAVSVAGGLKLACTLTAVGYFNRKGVAQWLDAFFLDCIGYENISGSAISACWYMQGDWFKANPD